MTKLKISIAALSLVVQAGFGWGAQASVIVGLYNTGEVSPGVVTVGDVADPHWTVQGLGPYYNSAVGPAYNSVTNGSFPQGPWVPDSSVSRWATPTSNAAQSFDPVVDGQYLYTLDFTMTSTTDATFTAQFAADNAIYTIDLNGNLLLAPTRGNAGSGPNYFSDWTTFSAPASDFVTGKNVLTIDVDNYAQNGGNPSGLNVEFLSSSVGVPEPTVWAMLIVGFLGIGSLLRRRAGAVLPA
jgi:hypothetical protein